MTDEVRKVSRKKQEAWMRCVKSPGNVSLKQEYQKWKVQSSKCTDKAGEEWWEAKAEEAEKLHEAAVALGHGGSLLKDLKLLCSRQKLKASTPLLSQDGTQLNSTVDKIERWREHFAQVSNVSVELMESVVSTVVEVPPLSNPECNSDNSDDHITCVPNEEEVRTALKLMKNGRAPGADGISAELLKLGGDTVVQWLLHLATVVWEEERVPEDWVKQLTIPLHKKGSMQDCDNYRGIALLSVPGKVFCRVIQRRLAKRAEKMLRENQCGFRRGRGCIDHIFTLRTLAEKAREFNTTLYLSFVDLRKAYDSVNWEALWLVLERRYQVPGKLIHILRALHQGTKGPRE